MLNKIRKVPMRMCVVTREKYPKKELIRVVKTENGVIVDETGKANGRGAYLKRDLEVIDKAQKSKALDRHLEINVPDEVYDKLRSMV